MAHFPKKVLWTKKPDYPIRINESHPLAKNIKFAMFPSDGGGLSHWDSKAGKFYTRSGDIFAKREVDGKGRHIAFKSGAGTTQYEKIAIGDIPALQISTEITILTGYKHINNPQGNWGRLIHKSNGTTGDQWGLAIEDAPNEGLVQFRINGTYLASTTACQRGTYYDIACTYKSGDKNIFIDGAVESTTSAQTGSINTTGDCAIGAHADGINRGLYGNIYYVIVLDRVLSPAEIFQFKQNPYQLLQPRTQYIPISAAPATFKPGWALGSKRSGLIGAR